MGRRRKPHHRQGRQPNRKMLDMGQTDRFKHYVKKALERSDIEEDYINSFYTTLFSKGSRQGIGDAKKFVDAKHEEELIDEDTRDELHRLLDRFSTMRS